MQSSVFVEFSMSFDDFRPISAKWSVDEMVSRRNVVGEMVSQRNGIDTNSSFKYDAEYKS